MFEIVTIIFMFTTPSGDRLFFPSPAEFRNTIDCMRDKPDVLQQALAAKIFTNVFHLDATTAATGVALCAGAATDVTV